MATSLAAQLKKLAVPQTSLLQRDKKRASLLFEPKEAAAINKETFYEIGINGLRELIVLNKDFEVFENSLFSLTSRNVERAVQDKGTNAKINKNIKKFLMCLSPYFLLKPAHETLEWLIYRFSIHEYNREDFFKLIFPYHETNMFARCLQLFDFLDENSSWHWLKPVQKSGIHLPKLTLYNHAAHDVAFLKFMGEMVSDGIHENELKSNSLTTLFTFYCTTTIGALEQTQELTEPQLNAILLPLLNGLKSNIPDYTASTYMITAQLLKKTKFSRKLLRKFVKTISDDSQKHLRMEATLLLLLIYQSQQDNYSEVSGKAIQNFAQGDWFPVNLRILASGGSFVLPLLVPVLNAALKKTKTDLYRNFVEKLFTEVRLDDVAMDVLIRIVLDNCPTTAEKNQPREEDEETDEAPSKVPTVEWYGTFLKRIETQFPNAFDKVVNNVMRASKNSSAEKHKQALRSIMTVMISGISSESKQTLFEKLYHPNADFRLDAVQFLVKNFTKLTVKDKEMLEGAINERILDDDERIVDVILSLPNKTLKILYGENNFVDVAIKLLVKCFHNVEWPELTKKLIKHVCFGETAKDSRFLLVVLPFLFPKTKQLDIAYEILNSDFSKNYSFLIAARKNILKGSTSNVFCDAIYKSITDDNNLKDVNILKNLSVIPGKFAIYKYLSALLISTNLPNKCSPDLAVKALSSVIPLINQAKHIKTKATGVRSFVDAIRNNSLSLDGIMQCMKIIILRTECPAMHDKWLNLSNPDPSVKFLITILTVLLNGCATEKQSSNCFSDLLKEFLSKFFPEFKHRINFFANFIAVDGSSNFNINAKTQLRLIKVIHSLLTRSKESISWTVDSKSNILVPAVLTGLINPLPEIRAAVMELVSIMVNCICTAKFSYKVLLQEILSHKEEILLDADQLPLILCTTFSVDNMSYNSTKHSLDCLCSMMADTTIPIYITSMLLRVLTFTCVESMRIFNLNCKIANHILIEANNKNIVLDAYKSYAVYNNILRMNEITAKDFNFTDSSWKMIEYGLKQDIVCLDYQKDKYACPSVLILDQINKEIFTNFKSEIQNALIKILVEIATHSENPDVISHVYKLIKKIDLDAKLLVQFLTIMQDVKSNKNIVPQRKFRKVREIPTADILSMQEWKQGITVLEFIQDKKKLTNSNILLPILFKILKRCLDFDEQGAVEYPKQILLSAILHICNKMEAEQIPLPANAFNMELVVQCIRASQNPQTHHHALLVLAHTACLIPEQVLHNIMAIFTFMGSSVLRHDDAYSFQIISKIIDTIIPILVEKTNNDTENNVASVLRVFVDVILDVPEHRRMPLFKKLLVTLGVEEYLSLFLTLVFEAHVIHGADPKPKDTQSRLLVNTESIPKRLLIATNIALEFPPEIVIRTTITLLEHVKKLPVEKDDAMMEVDSSTSFNVQQHTSKQFRHYKYTLVTFLSGLLSSKQFVNTIAMLSNKESLTLEPLYKDMIINILTYIQSVSKTVDRMVNTPQTQYWKVMLHHCYDIMDSINALLTPNMFLLVIRGLIVHNILTVRRKAMEILNTKLQYQPSFFYSNPEDTEISETDDLLALIPSLINIIKAADQKDLEPEQELIQQTALLSLKLLIKLLAAKHPEKFTSILDFVTDLIKSNQIHGNILASVMLSLAELCSKLRAHAIPGLVRYMPAVIKILRAQKLQETPGLLLLCIITAIQKIVESLPLFLSPYLEKILCELTVLSAKWTDADDNQKLTPFIKKLDTIRRNIGSVIPSRILIPIVSQTYNTLLKNDQYTAIGPLMNVLAENLTNLQGNEFNSHLQNLTTFFLTALQFRTDYNSVVDADEIQTVEDNIIKTLTILILKLSETTFRPFYYRLFDWAVRSEAKSERVITFYGLSCGIAESLKGLFVLFAGHFVKNAASLLESTNTIKNDHLYFDDENKNVILAENILKTLKAVFLYDSKSFVDKDRFETLMQPIVDQLENTIGGIETLTERATNLIIPCIAQFAVATADDALWKQLNYQVLLKTRHTDPAIRMIALKCLCEVARKVGEDFLPLLPETIPFLAELLEDEDESVESACQKVVQDLEVILGEPLQKYF